MTYSGISSFKRDSLWLEKLLYSIYTQLCHVVALIITV